MAATDVKLLSTKDIVGIHVAQGGLHSERMKILKSYDRGFWMFKYASSPDFDVLFLLRGFESEVDNFTSEAIGYLLEQLKEDEGFATTSELGQIIEVHKLPDYDTESLLSVNYSVTDDELDIQFLPDAREADWLFGGLCISEVAKNALQQRLEILRPATLRLTWPASDVRYGLEDLPALPKETIRLTINGTGRALHGNNPHGTWFKQVEQSLRHVVWLRFEDMRISDYQREVLCSRLHWMQIEAP